MWPNQKLYFSSEDFFIRVIEEIKSAKRSIEIETYIFKADALGGTIIEHLIQASKRGVEIRLLIDGVGSWDFPSQLVKKLRDAKVKVRVYHPLPAFFNFHSAFKPRSNESWFNTVIRLWGQINLRNHRKTFIFDHSSACTGSMNILLPESLRRNQTLKDTGVFIQGPNIQELVHAFDRAWSGYHQKTWRSLKAEKSTRTSVDPNALVRLNYASKQRRFYYHDFIHRIRHASHQIYLETPYFVPNRKLLAALRYAAKKRKVDVRLLLPQKTDVFLCLGFLRFLLPLLKSGVRIFEYQSKMLHSKVAFIDDWAIVGSSNLNHRSLIHDLEADIQITDSDQKAILKQELLNDYKCANEIQIQTWKAWPFWFKLLGRFF